MNQQRNGTPYQHLEVKRIWITLKSCKQQISGTHVTVVSAKSMAYGRLKTWNNTLKAHRQISKKQCFKKYCSYDQVCQFSAL